MKKCPHCGEAHRDEMLFCPKTGKAISVSRIAPGALIDDKYEVVRRVASGGMGAVYEAVHKRIGRHVAIKLILPELAASEEVSQRFEIEARAASAIGHENIVEIFDLGTTSDGLPFLVMEFLKGRDLGSLIEEQGALPVSLAQHVISQVLDALAAAHAQKIIHRDLKPENVFLVSRGDDPYFVKLLDFGISKMCGGEEAKLHLTSTGLILGTPFYMSPEQARGEKDIDHRSDLFSAGTMLYQALTGRRPFTADNLNKLLYQIIGGRIVPPLQANPELPKEMERVLLKALAVDTDDRFGSAKEFKEALLGQRLISTAEIAFPPQKRAKSTDAIAYSPTIGGNTPGPMSADTATPMAWADGGKATTAPGKKRWLLGAGAGAVTLLVAVGAFLLFYGWNEPEKKEKQRSAALQPDQPGAAHRAGSAGRAASAGGARNGRASPARKTPQTTETVEIKLNLEPPDAQVFLNGKRVDSLPLQLPRSPEKHELMVKKKGYRSKTLPVIAEKDHVLVIALPKAEEASTASRPRSGRPAGQRKPGRTRRPSRPRTETRTRPRDGAKERDIKAFTDF
jgi:serine/threonine-protein kinase